MFVDIKKFDGAVQNWSIIYREFSFLRFYSTSYQGDISLCFDSQEAIAWDWLASASYGPVLHNYERIS